MTDAIAVIVMVGFPAYIIYFWICWLAEEKRIDQEDRENWPR